MVRFALSTALLLTIFSTTGHGGLISFQFKDTNTLDGIAGLDLDGKSNGSTSASNGGITLTLSASVSRTGVFNQTTTGFGINAQTSGDDTDAFDGGVEPEAAKFSLVSNVTLSSLRLVSFKFDRFDGIVDAGSLIIDGGSTFNFDDDDLDAFNFLDVDELISPGQAIDLLHVGGAWGLERITFEATIPEPSSFALAGIGLFGVCLSNRRRRR